MDKKKKEEYKNSTKAKIFSLIAMIVLIIIIFYTGYGVGIVRGAFKGATSIIYTNNQTICEDLVMKYSSANVTYEDGTCYFHNTAFYEELYCGKETFIGDGTTQLTTKQKFEVLFNKIMLKIATGCDYYSKPQGQ